MARRTSQSRSTARQPAAASSAAAGLTLDGRRRRGEDTRRRLFEAMLVLMAETSGIPTIGAIAARAKVGLRTLYQHFPEAQSLYAATFDYVVTTTLSTMPPVSPQGSLGDRIAGFVERRARVCEAWAPIWRVALRFAASDAAFRERVERVNQLLRARAQILYSTELSQLPPEAQALLLDALLSLTEMDAWAYLRVHCRRDIAAAQQAWRFAIGALFKDNAGLRGA